MKGKRNKQYRKLMQQYGFSFGFREPYQVLVDAQMIQDTERFKMDLVAGLERTLSGKVKPMITQCSIRHLYNLADTPRTLKDSLILTAKSMERRRCDHHTLENPLSNFECLSAVIDPKSSLTNRHRYIVASQDESLRKHCRTIKGVPLVYVKRSVMIMEPMASGSVGAREGIEREKFKSGLKSRTSALGKRKRDVEPDLERDLEIESANAVDGIPERVGGEEKDIKKKKSRGPKGPNPLSVKKSKKAKERKGQADHIKSESNPANVNSSGIWSDIQQPKSKRRKKRRGTGQLLGDRVNVNASAEADTGNGLKDIIKASSTI